MGYTNYLRNQPPFSDAAWSAFCLDARAIFKKHSRIVANGCGEVGSRPVIKRDEIYFNGKGDESHETCAIHKNGDSFSFTKTAHKAYDVVVVEIYKLVRKYLPATELSSDGGDKVFGGQKIVVDRKWTYLTGDFVVAVGDEVLLPSGVKYDENRTWEGIVTSLNGNYTGNCKYILGVVTKAPVVGPLDHLDADDQISTEEAIATMLTDDYAIHEEVSADMSRKVLLIVAQRLGIK